MGAALRPSIIVLFCSAPFIGSHTDRQSPPGPHRSAVFAHRQRTMEFAVAGLPKQSLAYTNCVYVHPDDLARMRAAGPLASAEFDREVEAFGVPMRFGAVVFAAKAVAGVDIAPGSVGMNGLQRRTGAFSLGQRVATEAFVATAESPLDSISLEISPLKKRRDAEAETIDCQPLNEHVLTTFRQQVLSVGQQLAIDFQGLPLMLKVTALTSAALAAGGDPSATGAASRSRWRAPRRGGAMATPGAQPQRLALRSH